MPRLWILALMMVSLAPERARSDEPASKTPMLMGQPVSDYQARRREVMKAVKAGDTRNGRARGETVVILRGGDDQGGADFEEGRFRQQNDFAYLTGVDAPGAWLVLVPSQDRSTLYLPPRAGSSVMNGENRKPGPGSEAAEALGFDSVEPTSKFLGDVFTWIADPMRRGPGGAGVVFTLSPSPSATDINASARFTRFLKEGAPNASFRDLAPILGELRKIKTPTEIAILQKAIDITGEAQNEVMRHIKPDLFEYQLEAKIHGAFTNGGALRPGFASIVGSGPNATIPHYFENDRQLESGDLVVVDIGGEYKNYTADITRTYPVNGKFTPRQREIYQLVLDAQTAAFKHTKLGETTMPELTRFVRDYLKKSPLRAKDTDGKEYTMDHFFIHGLGHYLGMDVHDVGDYSKPMQVGEVFTIEPGIYIKPENIGVRIEDDYLMTETGPIKMSKNIPSEVDAIEAQIAAGRGKRN